MTVVYQNRGFSSKIIGFQKKDSMSTILFSYFSQSGIFPTFVGVSGVVFFIGVLLVFFGTLFGVSTIVSSGFIGLVSIRSMSELLFSMGCHIPRSRFLSHCSESVSG